MTERLKFPEACALTERYLAAVRRREEAKGADTANVYAALTGTLTALLEFELSDVGGAAKQMRKVAEEIEATFAESSES